MVDRESKQQCVTVFSASEKDKQHVRTDPQRKQMLSLHL